MDNTANRIFEEQVDTLAERVARLEADLAGLRETLSKPDVLALLGLDKSASALNPLVSTFKASGVRYQHRQARRDAITQARREALLDRLDRADRFSSRTGRTFIEAWEALSRE